MDLAVPFFSVQAVQQGINLLSPIQRVLESHHYILGKEVDAFEKEFANYINVAHCISLGNGTDALELALRAVGVVKGDTVLLAANAGFYSSTALHVIGATPYYVDVDPITLTLSAEKIQTALSVKPKAIIVTHLYGQLADIENICEMAAKVNVPVIEDCAQAHGAQRKGKRAGSFGKLACFSFYPTKNLGALGDGGAVVTQETSLAGKLKQLRQYGWEQKYHVKTPLGRNSRLDEIQAAILREKLFFLDEHNKERRMIARQYNQAFSHLPMICPALLSEENVVHLYVIRLKKREAFRDYLQKKNIHTDVLYPIPDHLQSAYHCSQTQEMLPVTEQACREVVSLPCYPGLNTAQINLVMNTVNNYFE